MTYLERLKKEHPERVDEHIDYRGLRCPHSWGYVSDYCCPIDITPFTCETCWNREIPGTEPAAEEPTIKDNYNLPKPPLGVSSYWYVYHKRMEELQEGIGRYLAHIKSSRRIAVQSDRYKVIAGWCEELKTLALLEAKIENDGGNKA